MYFVVVVVVVFLDRVSLCSSGSPEMHSVDQAGLTLRDPPASAGIKGVCHHGLTGFVLFLMALYLFS